MLNAARLELARKRRRLTAKALAEKANISHVTLSRIINHKQEPDPATVAALAAALDYPTSFLEADDPDLVGADAVSFRSLKRMTAKQRDAAIAASALAFELMEWVLGRFDLPEPDLLDLHNEQEPEAAARMLRQHWAIGEKPVKHMIRLLETKGVRVFSLAEDTKNVDAFSFWRDGEPFVFLNTFKSAERSRFDAAHELGHLVLHAHGGPGGRQAETEANRFASAFLMPSSDVRSKLPYVVGTDQIVSLKRRWGVSAVALAYRLQKMGRITEWQYVQVSRQYRTEEPNGMDRERSAVWEMVLRELWQDGMSRAHLAEAVAIPEDELQSLLFGLTESVPTPERVERSALRAV